MQPFKSYWPHKFFANFFCCHYLVILLSSNIALEPLMIQFCCKRQKIFFWWDLKLGEKKFQNFLPLGGGGVGGRHSSPPIFFHKKLRKVGLFLRTFFRIKIFAAIPKLLASQVFFKLFLLSECCRRVVSGCSTETVHKQNIP